MVYTPWAPSNRAAMPRYMYNPSPRPEYMPCSPTSEYVPLMLPSSHAASPAYMYNPSPLLEYMSSTLFEHAPSMPSSPAVSPGYATLPSRIATPELTRAPSSLSEYTAATLLEYFLPTAWSRFSAASSDYSPSTPSNGAASADHTSPSMQPPSPTMVPDAARAFVFVAVESCIKVFSACKQEQGRPLRPLLLTCQGIYLALFTPKI